METMIYIYAILSIYIGYKILKENCKIGHNFIDRGNVCICSRCGIIKQKSEK